MHNKIWAVSRDLRPLDAPGFPLWFTEGLAELWSDGWDSQAELIIRDAVLHDYLFPLNSFELYSSGFLLYKEGQAFLRFYEQEYTADRLRALMEDYWQYESFEEAVTAVSGRDFDDIVSDWRLALKKEYATPLQDQDIFPVNVFQITEEGANASPAVYTDSQGNRRVAYISTRNGYLDIYHKQLVGGKAEPLIRGEREAKRESLHFLRSGIHVNDQGQLAYVSKLGPRDVIRLYDIAEQTDVLTMQHPDIVSISSPKWSPDGAEVVFSGHDPGGQVDLYRWNTLSDEIEQLTDDIFSDDDPHFGPFGRYIVFSSDRGQESISDARDICILDTKDHQVRLLTRDTYVNTEPIWHWRSPDMLYYLSDASGTANAWQLKMSFGEGGDISALGRRQLTDYHTGLENLQVTSDDSLLVSVFQKYSFQLHHLPVQTDSVFQYVNLAGLQSPGPAWTIPAQPLEYSNESRPYKLKYSLDFAQTSVAYDPIFGYLGGAQLGISDVMGDRYYHFLLANTAQTQSEFLSRFNVAVTLVDLAKRSNRALGIFRFANDYFDPYQGFYEEQALGTRMALNYPIDVFRRIEFSTSFWQSYKKFYGDDPVRSYLISNYVSYVHDNSLWTYTGPIDGFRIRLTVGPTFDFQRARIHNYTAMADLRSYYRILPNLTFAQRTTAWVNEGIDIHRFYIGGSWGLRGYGFGQIYGQKYILLNQELRFPFAQNVSIGFKSANVGLAPIRGALFVDAGNAWDNDYPGFIGSMGVGLRGVLMGALVLRLDMGRTTDFNTVDNDWFFQFFFGWDY